MDVILPIDFHIFQRGRYTTKQVPMSTSESPFFECPFSISAEIPEFQSQGLQHPNLARYLELLLARDGLVPWLEVGTCWNRGELDGCVFNSLPQMGVCKIVHIYIYIYICVCN